MITLKNITKKYGSLTVYDGFDLQIAEGEITCLLGPSGCGKTTLLNILAGLTPYGGEVSYKGGCSYIFQTPRLVPNLTAEGNLKLVCADGDKVAEMLKRVGLMDKASAYPKELSGGQAQRVAIARAFLRPGGLLLMDEPFSSLDTALKIKLVDLFFDLWRDARPTVVFVTHDAEEACMMSHRAVLLDGGRVKADITAADAPPRKYGAACEFKERIISKTLE